MTYPTRPTSGYSAWRLIAEELRREILGGSRAPGSKLPSETELAERFGVHRNTVRQAVAALAAEQLVVARRGSGRFVAEHAMVVHRIGLRTRLSQSLGQRGAVTARLLDWALEPTPPAEVAHVLGPGRAALRLEGMRSLDGVAISRATQWFDAELTPGLPELYRHTDSITVALKELGINDYLRTSTLIGARIATVTETEEMELPPGTIVLVVRAVDSLPDGRPLQTAVSRFRADRVELDVEHPLG